MPSYRVQHENVRKFYSKLNKFSAEKMNTQNHNGRLTNCTPQLLQK